MLLIMRLIPIFFIIALLVGGYTLYTYLKQKPPTALIEALTKTDPPPPLPPGDRVPLIAPPAFTVTAFAKDIPNARVLVRDPKGTMVVSQTKDGKVVALPDLDRDHRADRTIILLDGLDKPHGLAFSCPSLAVESESTRQDSCLLYVAETGVLKSYAYDADTGSTTFKETLTTFPVGDGHYTRTLLLSHDGKTLYMSVGSSCNVCHEEDPRRATVLSLDLDTKRVTAVARGLRNTVFMAFDPVTGALWGTDNGRDIIGDDIPPDEINIIKEGGWYGWPICYGAGVHDTDFDKKQYGTTSPCAGMTPPHISIQAHSAPLGLAFIPKEGWPADMHGDMLVAYHGSWNRSEPTGYKVVRFDLAADRSATGGPIDFLTGFLTTKDTDDALGRPVGILVEPGVAYISDDRAGAIYRVAANQ